MHHLDAPDGDHGERAADLLLRVEGEVAEEALVRAVGILAAMQGVPGDMGGSLGRALPLILKPGRGGS